MLNFTNLTGYHNCLFTCVPLKVVNSFKLGTVYAQLLKQNKQQQKNPMKLRMVKYIMSQFNFLLRDPFPGSYILLLQSGLVISRTCCQLSSWTFFHHHPRHFLHLSPVLYPIFLGFVSSFFMSLSCCTSLSDPSILPEEGCIGNKFFENLHVKNIFIPQRHRNPCL